MITIEQRITLLNGGYTPEQIAEFENAEINQEPQPTPQPEPQPTPGPEPQPTPGPEPQPTPGLEPQPTPQPEQEPQPEFSNADVMQAIAGLKSLIQASNLQNDFIPNVKPQDAADVLAQVIRPERKK